MFWNISANGWIRQKLFMGKLKCYWHIPVFRTFHYKLFVNPLKIQFKNHYLIVILIVFVSAIEILLNYELNIFCPHKLNITFGSVFQCYLLNEGQRWKGLATQTKDRDNCISLYFTYLINYKLVMALSFGKMLRHSSALSTLVNPATWRVLSYPFITFILRI